MTKTMLETIPLPMTLGMMTIMTMEMITILTMEMMTITTMKKMTITRTKMMTITTMKMMTITTRKGRFLEAGRRTTGQKRGAKKIRRGKQKCLMKYFRMTDETRGRQKN